MPDTQISDLRRAYDALSGKNTKYATFWQYYDGDQPVTYLNERLREVFRSLEPRFTENWCGVVISSCLDRINLTGFTCQDEATQQALDAQWAAQDLHQESDDAHEAALVCGESFIIIWPDADNIPQEFYNDPRMCHCFYEPENPRKMQFAAKWWDTDDGKRRMTLYYPDRLEYYISSGRIENVASASAFVPYQEDGADAEGLAPNPYGQVPVFHFRMDRRSTKSDLADVIPIQNGVNKLLSDMMVAAEFQALPQRYIISQSESLGKLKNAANEIWNIPASDGVGQGTQVGQFSAADLGNFQNTIAGLVDHIAAITRTPKHYFFLQGGDPSGEALQVMESALVSKATKRIERFTPVWQQAASFMLKILNMTVAPNDITPVFDTPKTQQPLTQAMVRKAAVEVGIPLVTTLKKEGWSQAEIDAMEKDKQAVVGETQNLGALLLQNFEKGQTGAMGNG